MKKRIKGIYHEYNRLTNKIPASSKWISLIAGIFMELGAGNQYAFGNYSSQIRMHMRFNILEVDLMGTTMNVFLYTGVIFAFFYDAFGPRPTCLLSGTLCFIGYFCVWLSLKQWIIVKSWWVFCMFFALIGCGNTCMYLAGLATSVKNFDQKHRGKVVGILVSFFGLSAGFFGMIFKYILHKDYFGYILFSAVLLCLIPYSCFFVLNLVKKDDLNEDVNNNITHEYENIDKPNKDSGINNSNGFEKKKEEKAIKQVSPLKMLVSLDFYLTCVIMFSGIGSGLVVINSIHEMVISYGGKGQSLETSSSIASTLVIIISVFNTFGRLFFGFISDLTSDYFSRTGWLTLSILLMSIGQFLCSFSSVEFLYFVVVIVAIAYGGIFALAPAFISECFGEKFFAVNWSCTQIPCAFGSILIASLLQSYIFKKHSLDNKGILCYGHDCFLLTFFITTILCIVAGLAGILLHYRTNKLYQRIYDVKQKKKKFKLMAISNTTPLYFVKRINYS